MGNIKLENITKKYGDVVAVDNLNVDIQDGEFISLVGPSGCGKSTTLECVAGLTQPSSGNIEIAGKEVTNLPPKDRDIAMVFQNIALFPHLSVYDNMAFGLRVRANKKTEDEIDDRVHRAAEILQIQDMLDRMPKELSGGQQQRVAIGRAIVREPEVFLMDEPLANLDAKLRVHMRTEIARIHKELNTTIVYVTHDQEEAMTMSDRITVISDGELQQIASPLTCYNEPANMFVAGFIGSPSMNFLEGDLDQGTFKADSLLTDIEVQGKGADASSEATVGIRPEDIYLIGSEIEQSSESISATTEVLEPVGKEIFVYLDLPNHESDQLLMSVSPDTDIEEDQEVEIVFDRAQTHLFDTQSGDAISHGIVERSQTIGME